MARDAVMFDLDGTLADTLADIAAAGNHALQSVGRSPAPVERYRYLAGQGVDYLVEHALAEHTPAESGGHDPAGRPHDEQAPPNSLFDRFKAAYLKYYEMHKYDHTRPFIGVPSLLHALTQQGVRRAVLSNKHESAAVEMVTTSAVGFDRWRFDVVRGARGDTPLKPDPTAALAIAGELDIAPVRWAYVGDTRADMLTGKAAGMFTVGVTWGFRDEAELRENGADAIIHEPLALLNALRQRES